MCAKVKPGRTYFPSPRACPPKPPLPRSAAPRGGQTPHCGVCFPALRIPPILQANATGHPVSGCPVALAQRVGFSAKATGSLSSRRRCLAPSLPGAGKRRTAAFASPPFESLPFYRPTQQDTLFQGVLLRWRRGWDSNPRDVSAKLISSFIAVCYLHGFSCQFQPALYARKPA